MRNLIGLIGMVTIFVALPLLQGCGAETGASAPNLSKAGKASSCNMIALRSLCNDFRPEQPHTACPGIFSNNACPTEKRVASCVSDKTTSRYYSHGPNPHTTNSVKAFCTRGAKFFPN